MEPVVLLETSRTALRELVCPGGGSGPPPWGLQEHQEGLGVSSVAGVGATPKTKAGTGRSPTTTLAVLEDAVLGDCGGLQGLTHGLACAQDLAASQSRCCLWWMPWDAAQRVLPGAWQSLFCPSSHLEENSAAARGQEGTQLRDRRGHRTAARAHLGSSHRSADGRG